MPLGQRLQISQSVRFTRLRQARFRRALFRKQ